jgi:hypothetical protein
MYLKILLVFLPLEMVYKIIIIMHILLIKIKNINKLWLIKKVIILKNLVTICYVFNFQQIIL